MFVWDGSALVQVVHRNARAIVGKSIKSRRDGERKKETERIATGIYD